MTEDGPLRAVVNMGWQWEKTLLGRSLAVKSNLKTKRANGSWDRMSYCMIVEFSSAGSASN